MNSINNIIKNIRSTNSEQEKKILIQNLYDSLSEEIKITCYLFLKRNGGYKLDISDCMSEANLKFVHALETYDLESQISFLTYWRFVTKRALVTLLKSQVTLSRTKYDERSIDYVFYGEDGHSISYLEPSIEDDYTILEAEKLKYWAQEEIKKIACKKKQSMLNLCLQGVPYITAAKEVGVSKATACRTVKLWRERISRKMEGN